MKIGDKFTKAKLEEIAMRENWEDLNHVGRGRAYSDNNYLYYFWDSSKNNDGSEWEYKDKWEKGR